MIINIIAINWWGYFKLGISITRTLVLCHCPKVTSETWRFIFSFAKVVNVRGGSRNIENGGAKISLALNHGWG